MGNQYQLSQYIIIGKQGAPMGVMDRDGSDFGGHIL